MTKLKNSEKTKKEIYDFLEENRRKVKTVSLSDREVEEILELFDHDFGLTGAIRQMVKIIKKGKR